MCLKMAPHPCVKHTNVAGGLLFLTLIQFNLPRQDLPMCDSIMIFSESEQMPERS